MFKSLPLSEVYRLLEPGPVVLVVTADKNKNNAMAMSWHTMLEFEPPLIGCVISGNDHTFDILKKTKECVIAVPTLEIAKKVVKAGNTSGRDIDKFKEIGFTAVKASRVKAPLIKDCYANIECKVSDPSLVGKYNFFVLKAVKAWIDPKIKNPRTIHHLGKGYFMTTGKIVKIASKMK